MFTTLRFGSRSFFVTPARLAVGLEAKNLRLRCRYAPVQYSYGLWFPRPCRLTEFGNMLRDSSNRKWNCKELSGRFATLKGKLPGGAQHMKVSGNRSTIVLPKIVNIKREVPVYDLSNAGTDAVSGKASSLRIIEGLVGKKDLRSRQKPFGQ